MGLGQTMLTVGFLVLLTVAVVGVNKMMIDKDANYYNLKVIEQAGILAGSLMEEISRKRFDEEADTSASGLQPVSEFTAPGSLGPDPIWSSFFGIPYISGYEATNVALPDSLASSSSTYRSVSNSNTRYDDIDDYHGYVRAATSGGIKGFRLLVTVNYVDTALTYTTSRTYLKKINVKVFNWYHLSDTASAHKIKSIDTLSFTNVIYFHQ